MVEISVIMASYKFPLHPILISLATQIAAPSFEVLICDDGSPENLLKESHETVTRFNLDVRFIAQPHRGFRLSRSRNNGIRCAQGKVLVFVDSDIWLPSSYLKNVWAAHQDSRNIVCGPRIRVSVEREQLFTLHETLGDLGALSELCDMPDNQPQKKWLNTEWPWMACLGCNMSIPALGHTLFDEHFQAWGGEDRDFALRQTVEGGLAVNYLPTTAVLHLELADQSILESVNCIGGPTDVVGWLRNRLILREKFPRDVIYPCMKMIRHCQLDLESDRWIFKEQENYDQDEDIILLNFSDWLKRHSAEA